MTLTELAGSFAGCDGGNPAAALWVCGIEPHGGPGVLELARDHLSPHSPEWRLPPSWPLEFAARLQREDWPPLLVDAWKPAEGTYDTLLATLCWHIFGGADSPGDYLLRRLYQTGGDIFKVNLFPLPCAADADWPERYKTVCEHKNEYRRQCVRARGVFLRGWIERQKPRVILCTGGGDRTIDFLNTFLDQPMMINHKMIHRYETSPAGCRILISPFLGRNLLGGADLVELAERIRGLLTR